MGVISFEATLVKSTQKTAKAFFAHNAKILRDGQLCAEIKLVPDFDNVCNNNSIMVIETSTDHLLGYLDETSSSKLALLNPEWISGTIQKISPKKIIVLVEAESFLPEDEINDIINEKSEEIVARYCPQMVSAAFSPRPPTFKQFSYAINLGIDPQNKSFRSISDDIDWVLENHEHREPIPIESKIRVFLYDVMCKNTPATDEQLYRIRELHGECGKPLNYNEANDAIVFLENHSFKCPYCHRKTANEDYCVHCERSMDQVHIPLFFEENNSSYSYNRKKDGVSLCNLYIILLTVLFLIYCFSTCN